MNLLLDYLIRWDYIDTCGYRIRLEVLQTATTKKGLVITCPSWIDIDPIRKEQDDRDCNSIKEGAYLR